MTAKMHQLISSGTFDSPSWELIRTSKLAARIYAPLGTQMSLGDHVRLSCTFLEAFKEIKRSRDSEHEKELTSENFAERELLCQDLKVFRFLAHGEHETHSNSGVSGQIIALGYQGRQNPSSPSQAYNHLSARHALHLVLLFIQPLHPRTLIMDTRVPDDILRSPQFQKVGSNL